MPWMTFLLPFALTTFSGSIVSSSERATGAAPSFFSSFLIGLREAVVGLGAAVLAAGAPGAAAGVPGAAAGAPGAAAGVPGAAAGVPGAAASEALFFGAGAFDLL